MKKQNLLKLAFTMLAMVIMTGAMAQVEEGDYSENATDNAGGITMHTLGQDVGLYVEPDAAYNPDYNAGDGWVLNPLSTWTWTLDVAGPEALTETVNSGTPANYVELNSPSVIGNYEINVAEGNTTTGCTDPAGTDHIIVYLPAPTMAVDASTGVAWGAGCGDVTAHTVTFDLTAAELANDAIWAQWRLEEYEVTIEGATGNPVPGATPVSTTVLTWDKFTATTEINGNDWTITDDGSFNADGAAAPALSNHTLSMSRDYTNAGGEIAYLYRWVISTGDGDGVNDRISRKSEYIDGGTGIYGTDGTIDIYIVNAPTTGPIYHVPNSYGN